MPNDIRGEPKMDDELQAELERLKKDKVVSEETAALYLGKLRAELNKSEGEDPK